MTDRNHQKYERQHVELINSPRDLNRLCRKHLFKGILSQTPNATRNMAEFNVSKFSRKTKMTNISQQQPITFWNHWFWSADKGSLSCVLIGRNLISVRFFVLIKFTKVCFGFCHSVTSLPFVKQCCMKKFGLSLFNFKAELGFIEINVSQTQNPILPMLYQYRCNSLKQWFFFFQVFFCCLGTFPSEIKWPSLFHGLLLFSEFRQE